jgi:pimeloyl-ACP methyl ester carboxylesterase
MPNVVFISGFMLDETLWDDVVGLLPRTWCVKRYALQGDTIPAMSLPILAELEEPAYVVGFSLGGYIARYMAEQQPKSVAGLILVASSARDDTDEQKVIKKRSLTSSEDQVFKGLSLRSIAKSVDPSRRGDVALLKRIQKMGERLGRNTFVQHSLLDRSSTITAAYRGPVLVVAGQNDEMRTDEEASELVSLYAGAKRIDIEDCGHIIPLESPQALGTLIQAFVNRNEH